ADDARALHGPLVLVAEDADATRLAVVDLHEAGIRDVKQLTGGFDAWKATGYTTEASADVPRDAECIDYLFFVHDRHAGNRAAMRQYLAWETGLLAQLDSDERGSFTVGIPSPAPAGRKHP
ncbi:MAG TPA: sulfurtransferase, partial [Burkholderiales bacterium]